MESTTAGLQQAEQRETSTEGARHVSAHLSQTHLLVHFGTGCWNLGFRRQARERTGIGLCGDILKGLECALATVGALCRKEPGFAPLSTCGLKKREAEPAMAASFLVCSQWAQLHLHEFR